MKIRPAEETDCKLILDFIHQLAEYEKLSDQVVASEELLRQTLFSNSKQAHAILLEDNEGAKGFALYFFSYSTFLARRGLYLEDLFVVPSARGRGYGKALFLELTRIAQQEKCGRMEWSVLDWNKPAIEFYESMGAKAMSDWTVYRLDEQALRKLTTP